MRMAYRIKELRKQRGWTQDHLAALTGLSKTHISEMESGKKNPSNPAMVALAEAFDVPVTNLFDGPTQARDAILAQIDRLSAEGQAEALAYVQYLLSKDQKPSD